jgi:anti-sigma-K factor RskA
LTNGAHIREEELQLLALGALPEEEAAAARKHAAECGECGARLAEARGQAALLAFAAAQEKPAATIKAELFAKIRAELHTEEKYRWPTKSDKAGQVKETGTGQRGAKRAWWQWALAPVAALLVGTVVEWKANQRLAGELEAANHQIVDMVNQRQRAEMLVDALSAPDTFSVKLAAAPEIEKATGMVRYNPRKGMVIYTAELPPLAADKIYQMWLVPKVGAPISAGIFAPGAHGTRQLWTAEVPVNTEVKAFAVTIEPAGGVAQPTGPKVLVGAS